MLGEIQERKRNFQSGWRGVDDLYSFNNKATNRAGKFKKTRVYKDFKLYKLGRVKVNYLK